MFRRLIVLSFILMLVLAACGGDKDDGDGDNDNAKATPQLAEKLVFYDWAEDFPPEVLAAFTEKYGVEIEYVTYEDQIGEAIVNMEAGNQYDIVVLGNEYIPTAVAKGLLAEINLGNVPNFKNISANFRDLIYDPDNAHSIPYNWGTIGIVYRVDLIDQPTSWNDLWKEDYAGKVGSWNIARSYVGATLLALGYSINTQDPTELAAAEAKLMELKPNMYGFFADSPSFAEKLLSGDVVIGLGYAADAISAGDESKVGYILPSEGSPLWGDNFTIAATTTNQYTAELFLNFILEPENAAKMVEYNYYSTPNDPAKAMVAPELANNTLIFPPLESLGNVEIQLPLSPEADAIILGISEKFEAPASE